MIDYIYLVLNYFLVATFVKKVLKQLCIYSLTVRSHFKYGCVFFNAFGISHPNTKNIFHVLSSWLFGRSGRIAHIRGILPLIICWFIWYRRNAVKHQGRPTTAADIQAQVMLYLSKLEHASILRLEF